MLSERNDNIATFGAEAEAHVSDETIQARAEMMLSIDEGVGQLVAALEEANQRENTLILLMSDNGYFLGEHGLTHERRLPYEEAIKSPMIASHPGAVAAGSRIEPFALAIDVAPTLVECAGAEIPARMQGRSLAPLLRGERVRWRDEFLVEYNSNDAPFPWLVNADYRAVRMGRYKYIRWLRHEDAEELYDFAADPYEMRNLAIAGEHGGVLRRARGAMRRLVADSLGLPNPGDAG
jgi:N-acetylglucosamine-6-sulfatase